MKINEIGLDTLLSKLPCQLEVPGFICEAYAEAGAEDITASGGWRFLEIEKVR